MTCFIGFGSLVNSGTHVYQPLAPVRVPGWSRAWINNTTYDHAFLSVVPNENDSILGLLARVPDADWSQLDIREAGYRRQQLAANEWKVEGQGKSLEPADTDDVQMYVHASGEFATPDKPILYSYLVTVLSGFYDVYGIPGLDNFLQSTIAWTTIKDDSSGPIYPRYVPPQGEAVDVVHEALRSIQ